MGAARLARLLRSTRLSEKSLCSEASAAERSASLPGSAPGVPGVSAGIPEGRGGVRRPRSRLGRMVATRWRKSGQLGLRQGVRWRRSGLWGGWWVSAGRGRGRGGGLTAQVKAGMVRAPRSMLQTARGPLSVAPAPPPRPGQAVISASVAEVPGAAVGQLKACLKPLPSEQRK